jgi:hypothetical protein
MSNRENKIKNPEACPGLREFLRPTPSYVKCAAATWKSGAPKMLAYALNATQNGEDPTKTTHA